ncbi:hypothetical protein BG005_009001 [Podila minutissima]|nr:hypothetical protein BG005_009001 [Podila minutissima]
MNNISDKQSREHARNASMTSDQDPRRPGATAMRAASQHRDSEFVIAQSEHGGAAPHSKGKGPSSKAPNKEPVSHLHQMAPVHGLKPSTIFSSIGGGRNSGSTTVRFRGQSHGSSSLVPPKEFVYREEDFQPLGHALHPTRSSNSGKGTSVPASSHGVHGIHRNPISSTLGLRSSDNHIRTSLGMNPALFLSRQKARFHVPSSSPPTSEGHAHAVPAHNDSKLKHHIYHVVNDPSDHHNHFRHQCDSEYCMDHNASHEHASHPSSISSYGRLAPHDHTSQAHRATNYTHARTKSPVSNIESLFKESRTVLAVDPARFQVTLMQSQPIGITSSSTIVGTFPTHPQTTIITIITNAIRISVWIITKAMHIMDSHLWNIAFTKVLLQCAIDLKFFAPIMRMCL